MFWCSKNETKIFPAGTSVYAIKRGKTWRAHPVEAPGYGRYFSDRRPLAGVTWISPLEQLAMVMIDTEEST